MTMPLYNSQGFTGVPNPSVRSEGELAAGLESERLDRGAIVTPQTLYECRAEWCATRLDFGWQRPGPAEASATFERHGLTGSFWSLT